MTVELQPVQKGDMDGVEKIQSNFEAINEALPTTGKWTDGASLLTADFAPSTDSGLSYRTTDTQLQFAGAVNPVKDITTTDGAVIGFTMMTSPVALKPYQYAVCTGTNGAYWTLQVDNDGKTLRAARYVYPKTGLQPVTTLTKSWWLALGGASFALA